MKKNYLIVCFLFALFLGLGAKDMAVSAATRKVIVEQPTEPGTRLDVGYRNPGSFFPVMIDSEAMVEVGTTLQIGVTSSGGAPLLAVRVNGEALPGSGDSYSYVIPEGEGDIVITAEFGSLFKLSFSSSANGNIECYVKGTDTPLKSDTRLEPNTEITVKILPNSGCELVSFLVNREEKVSEVQENVYNFVLTKDVTISAEFKKVFKIIIGEVEHGSIRVSLDDNGLTDLSSGDKILEGQELVVWEPQTDEGYEVASVLLNNQEIAFPVGTYRHTVSSHVKITVTTRIKKWDFAVEEFSEGTLKAEYVNGEDVVDVTSGGEIPDGSTLKIYEPEINEGYELVSVMLNDEEITDSFVEGVYTVVVKKDLKLVVNAKLKDKVFKFTVAEVEGASIDVQMFVNGDLAPLPEDGSVKNGTMVMISEPVLEDNYELISVKLDDEDITGLFEDGVYFHTVNKDVTLAVTTRSLSGVEDEQADRVRIYPNPFAESCVVSGVAAGTSVRVFNMTGACVFSKVAGTGETEIRLSGLASGVYILKLEKDGDSSCHKLIRK